LPLPVFGISLCSGMNNQSGSRSARWRTVSAQSCDPTPNLFTLNDTFPSAALQMTEILCAPRARTARIRNVNVPFPHCH
jgi:hypothetical protein